MSDDRLVLVLKEKTKQTKQKRLQISELRNHKQSGCVNCFFDLGLLHSLSLNLVTEKKIRARIVSTLESF